MPIAAMAVDTGGEGEGEESVTSQAYDWYRRLAREGLQKRVFLVKGSSSQTANRVRETWPDNTGRKARKSSARGDVPLYMLGTDLLKDAVAAMMDRDNPGAGYIHFPAWLERWFFEELTYEVRDPSTGKWTKPGKRPNEAFDLSVYNLVVFILLRAEKIDWSSPPPWAAEWDSNMLVGRPVTGEGATESAGLEPPVTAPSRRRKRKRVVKPRL